MDNSILGRGLRIQYTPSAAHVAGTLVLIGAGGLVGVAVEDLANGVAGTVELPPGVIYDISCKGHNGTANAAIAIGAKVYHTAGDAFECDVDSAATFFGYALEAVTSGSTDTINVYVAA